MKNSCYYTYEMMVLPEPANILKCISRGKRWEGGTRTETVDPQERTCRFPLRERLALGHPRSSATVVGFASNIMIRPGVWRRQPTLKLLLYLVAYKIVSADTSQDGDIDRL